VEYATALYREEFLMDSPLARVILALLGGYFIILLFLTVYDWISEEYPRRPPKSISETRVWMLNVRVLEEHQNGPLEVFVYFLDEIGIEKKDFVIGNTGSLHPRIYESFQLLDRQILAKHHSLIVFR
jgi:hypothetical protein